MGGDADSALPTAAKTAEGVIVETLSYMSPEQADGRTVDSRSDIFSLGVLFYELLLGRRPFQGDSPAATVSAILKDEVPPMDATPPIPEELQRLVRRCLAKPVRRRLQSSLDLRNELEEIRDRGTDVSVSPAATRRAWSPVALIVAGVIVAASLVASYFAGKESALPPTNGSRLTRPRQVTFRSSLEDFPDWSPDESTIAYHSNESGNFDIWVQQVGTSEALNRTADHEGQDQYPKFSPDGTQIAFWSDRNDEGFYVMPTLAGAPRKIARGRLTGPPQWSPDGRALGYIAYGDDGVHYEQQTLAGGSVTRSPLPRGNMGPLHPASSPDASALAFLDAGAYQSTRQPLVLLTVSSGAMVELDIGKDRAEFWTRKPSSRLILSS